MRHRSRTAQIAAITVGLMVVTLLIPFLLPEFIPKLDEQTARSIVEWVGYRRVLILALLVPLLATFIVLAFRYVRLHEQQPVESHSSDTTSGKAPSPLPRRQAVGGTWEQIEERQMTLLKHLAIDEKALLREFIDAKKRTMTLSIYHSTANGLTTQGILVVSNNYPDFQANYMVSDWAWTKLKEKPGLLK